MTSPVSRPAARHGRWVLAAISALLLGSRAPSAPAAEPAGLSSLLRLALHHEAERSGDFDALAARWLEAIRARPEGELTELLVRRLGSLEHRLRDPLALVEPLEAILGEGKLHGVARLAALDLLAIEHRRAGHRPAWRANRKARGGIGRFLVIGPFGKGRAGALRIPFPPEREIDPRGAYRDRWQTLYWRAWSPEGADRVVRPGEAVYPSTRGVSYFLAAVKAPAERTARLHLEGGGRYRIWLGSRLVIDDARPATMLARHRVAPVRLAAGWNRLLVKTRGDFRLWLSDERDDPLSLREWSPAQGAKLPEAAEPVSGESILEPGTLSLAARLEARLESDERAPPDPLSRALLHAAASLLWRLDGRADLAVDHAETAVALAPDDPWVLHQAARAIRAAGYLPPSRAKSRAQELWNRVFELDPGFRPGRVNRARLLLADQKASEAARDLEEVVAETPGFLYGLLELHRVYDSRGWVADDRRVLAKIREVAPALALPLLEEAKRAEARGNFAAAIEQRERALALDARRGDLVASLVGLDLARGDPKRAEARLRARIEAEPWRSSARRSLASFLRQVGRPGEAAAVLAELAAKRSWDPALQRDLGDALEEAGRAREAEAAWARALELDPGALRLRRALARRAGRSDAFWAPWDEELEDWRERVPESGPLVEKAAALAVIDISVLEVSPDGSTREYVHQAFRLLGEKAKDELAKVSAPGEIVRLRTLTPEGETLEPTAALGKKEFILPGVEPGAFTEIAFIIDRPGAAGRPVSNGPFFFQDFRYEKSFLLSRYVLLLPPGFDGGLLERQIGERRGAPELARVEKSERELEDGRRVVVWDTRRAARLRPEPGMPSRFEYVPNARVVPKRTWEEVAEELRDRALGSALLTPELRREAARVTEGIDDPLEKARALYKHVNDLVATSRGPATAVGVLLEKAGDRTLLLKALLDAAEVPNDWAWLRPAEASMPRADWDWPEASFYPARYLRVGPASGAGEPSWVSLRSRFAPFGLLPELFSGGRALVLTPGGHRVVDLPARDPDSYASLFETKLRLAADRSAEVGFVMTTRAAIGYRQKDRFRTLPPFQKNVMGNILASRLFPGAKVAKVEFRGLDDPAAPFALAFELKAPGVLSPSGDDLLLRWVRQPLQLMRSIGGPAHRSHPYHLTSPRAARRRVRLELGGAWRVGKPLQTRSLASPLGRFSLRSRQEGSDVLVIEEELVLRPGRLEPEEFPAFLAFLEGVDAAERESVVLKAR